VGESQVEAKPQIFLSYAREDEERVEDLYQELSNAGFKSWMDKKDILPGEEWELTIQKAIRRSDFFLACLSTNSVTKRGFLQKEIHLALDIWQEKLEDDIYLIPARLEDCEVPGRLRKFQRVDLFKEDGWPRLLKAVKAGMERLAEGIKPFVQASTMEGTADHQLRIAGRDYIERPEVKTFISGDIHISADGLITNPGEVGKKRD
jgi:hypothetical protein